MATNSRPQVVFNSVSTQTETNDWTHETVSVTWTATMKNGSLLDAANAEVAALGAANAVKVIDDLQEVDKAPTVGDKVAVSVAVQGCVFNSAQLTYSDGAAVPSALTGLAAKLNTFK